MEFFNRIRDTVEILLERHKKEAVAGAILAAVLLNFIWILIPLASTLYRTSVQIGTLSKEVKAIREDEANENTITQDLEKIKTRLTASEEHVASGDIYRYLEALSKIASDSGVRIVKVQPIVKTESTQSKKPNQDKKPGIYQMASFEISASSGYHSVGRFLSQLEANPVFIKIMRVVIQTSELSAQNHDVTLQIQMVQKGAQNPA